MVLSGLEIVVLGSFFYFAVAIVLGLIVCEYVRHIDNFNVFGWILFTLFMTIIITYFIPVIIIGIVMTSISWAFKKIFFKKEVV